MRLTIFIGWYSCADTSLSPFTEFTLMKSNIQARKKKKGAPTNPKYKFPPPPTYTPCNSLPYHTQETRNPSNCQAPIRTLEGAYNGDTNSFQAYDAVTKMLHGEI